MLSSSKIISQMSKQNFL